MPIMTTYNGKSKIIDVKWTPKGNVLIVKCGRCDCVYEHKTTKWNQMCVSCGNQTHINTLRNEWIKSFKK